MINVAYMKYMFIKISLYIYITIHTNYVIPNCNASCISTGYWAANEIATLSTKAVAIAANAVANIINR